MTLTPRQPSKENGEMCTRRRERRERHGKKNNSRCVLLAVVGLEANDRQQNNLSLAVANCYSIPIKKEFLRRHGERKKERPNKYTTSRLTDVQQFSFFLLVDVAVDNSIQKKEIKRLKKKVLGFFFHVRFTDRKRPSGGKVFLPSLFFPTRTFSFPKFVFSSSSSSLSFLVSGFSTLCFSHFSIHAHFVIYIPSLPVGTRSVHSSVRLSVCGKEV